MADLYSNEYYLYDRIDEIPYNIIAHLVKNEEDLWKLLYYPDANALNKDNLTLQQKSEIVYDGQTDMSQYHVFTNSLTDDAMTATSAIMRIYFAGIYPTNRNVAIATFELDVLSSNKIIQLSDHFHRNRALKMMQCVLRTLNGADVDPVS